jgi:hypothetical protein
MSITGEIVSESGPVKTGVRAKLVEEVFLRYLDARRAFNLALERCALKGWPDRSAAVRNAARLQELFYEILSLRLKHLVLRSASNDIGWNEYTSTEKVQVRVQDGWSEHEEQTLRLRDTAYAQIQSEITKLQAAADPETLIEPFNMAKRDPELVSAGWRLNNTVLALDRELALQTL